MAPNQHPLPEVPPQLGKHRLPEVLTRKNLPRALLAAVLLALIGGRTRPARANETTPGDPKIDPATILAADPSVDANANPDPDAGTPNNAPPDPADLNGDGTVTNKEQRQYNRAQRRKKRAAAAAAAAANQPDPDQTSDGSGTGGPTGGGTGAQGRAAAATASATATAQDHSASAGTKASAAADSLKNSLPSADADALKSGGPGGAGKPGSTGGSAAAGAGAKPSGNPSDPRSPADFVLAARSGYAPAFAAAGLKLGADGRSIVRADGSPATAEDYARLRRGILDMPAALSRRPDFFAAVSPAHFNDLKDGYRENPDLAGSVYKHVGTTDGDRDFVTTASCAKISGSCNENIDKTSYKKGDYVAPEDLDRMWGSLQKELDDAENPDGAAPQPKGELGPDRRAPAVDAAAAEEKTPDSATAGSGKAAPGAAAASATPAAAAAQAARRLWRATAAAFGLGGGESGGASSHALGLGALGAAALAAIGFALRKNV